MVLAFVAVQGSLMLVNRIAYGAATSIEIKSSPFKDALAALQSVEVGERIPYVPVSHQARLAIYEVSPTFRSLKDYLDPPSGSPWQFGCQFYPQTCGDIAGGWFLWALRDAAAVNGHYASPKASGDFYRALTQEVQQACKEGRLKCSTSLLALMPHISYSQWASLPHSLLYGLDQVTFRQPMGIDPGLSRGDPGIVASTVAFLGYPPRTPSSQDTDIYEIAGWYYPSPESWIAAEQTSTTGEVQHLTIAHIDSPDLVKAFKDPAAQHRRFDTRIQCGNPCSVKFVTDSGQSLTMNLSEAVGRQENHPLGSATLNFDRISKYASSYDRADIRSSVSAYLRSMSASLYRVFLSWLAALAFITMIFVSCISLVRRHVTTVGVMAAVVWTLFVSRLVLLGVVDISSFPGMILPYLSPEFLLLCIAITLSFGALRSLIAQKAGLR
jgi:hypothetical protein